MKQLLILLCLFSLNAFAQDYHDYDFTPKCSREACIVNDDSEYGLMEVEDRGGETYLKMNTSSSLLDLPFEGMCFKGDQKEVVEIVEGLAGNANEYYPQGGHFAVVGLFAKTLEETKVVIEVTILSDYDRDLLKEDLVLTKCN